VIVAAATLLRFAVDPLIHDQIPYFIFVAAVVSATWFCGVDGGILATVIAAFAGNYFFVPPRHEFVPHGEDWIAMAMFAAVGLGLVWQVGRWKRTEGVLRSLHAEAERVNRLKDEFLATLSHELRTPLNAILGWAQLLNAGRLDPTGQKEAARTIMRNAEAQARLVNDILDVSRIISGKMHLKPTTVDVPSIASAAIAAVRPAAQAKGVEITEFLPEHLFMVGDADRLQQVAWNLLSNAVKFTPKGGRVDVRVEQKESQAVLSVADTGIGMEPDFLPYLFERFRQADSSTTRRHGGLGLGLAVVRHLVELHGGTVRAESAGANRGSTFTIALPIRAVTSREPDSVTTPDADLDDVAEAEVPRLVGIRVLAVDDDPDARELVREALTEFGATVRTAASAREAIEMLQAWKAHVLIADIGMPDEDGYSLIKRVRMLAPEAGGLIPAVALTAYAQEDDRTRVLNAGYQEHVPKPATPRHIALVVEALATTRPPVS
jgi:signal transduction histidine kinase/ActR/RegA family two-component response regulator